MIRALLGAQQIAAALGGEADEMEAAVDLLACDEQRSRASLAVALLRRTPLMLLEEPTVGTATA